MNPRQVMLAVLNGETPPYTPVWIMRQAGRYLPEYRQLRAKVGSFQALYSNPELASKVTLMPMQRFPLDAAVIFSDILIALDAISLEVSFASAEAGEAGGTSGPKVLNPITSEKDVDNLPQATDLNKYDFLAENLKISREELKDRGLIGFIGSPWTLAAYAVEGSNTKNFSKLRAMMYQRPQLLHKLLKRLADELIELAILQIDSGADIIQIFDSWAGLLGADQYEEFSYKYMANIIADIRDLRPATPLIIFAKATPFSPIQMLGSNPNGLGIDWQVDIAYAFTAVGSRAAIQGNLDPAALYASELDLDKEISRIMQARTKSSRHIFNLGHGIYPDINPDRVAYLVDAVHNYE